MATELALNVADMALFEIWSKDLKRSQEERDMLAAMLKWSKSQTPNGGDWIYSWMSAETPT